MYFQRYTRTKAVLRLHVPRAQWNALMQRHGSQGRALGALRQSLEIHVADAIAAAPYEVGSRVSERSEDPREPPHTGAPLSIVQPVTDGMAGAG